MTALLDRPETDGPAEHSEARPKAPCSKAPCSTTTPRPTARRSNATPPKTRPTPGVRPRPSRPSGRPSARPSPAVRRGTEQHAFDWARPRPAPFGPGAPSAPAFAPRPGPIRTLQPRPLPYRHQPLVRPLPTKPATRRLRDRPATTWQWRVFLGVAALLTFGLHVWRVDTSFDLFIDEPFYAQVGQSISRGGMPYATGSPFFLHPPAFFVVEAGWMHLFGLHLDLFGQVFSLRRLGAVIGGLTALVLGVLVGKVVGRTAAVLVVLLYLINAFATQEGSMVILEPITLFWTISGYAVFAHLDPRDGRRRRRQIFWAAMLFGIATISKEFAVFVTLVPLAVAFALGCWLTRREALRAMLVTCVPWAVWLTVVAATGYWHAFFTQVTSGFHRTTGKTQISGFNAKGAPSFLDTVLANFGELWTTYAILGLGTVAIVHVFLRSRDDPRLRFLSLFGVGAIPLLAYCVLLGTNEEQFFNFLFFPALICLVAVATRHWTRLRRALQMSLLALLATASISDAAQYVIVHTQPDNGTYLIDSWMARHVAPGTVVGTTNSVQREIFLRYTMVDDAPNTRLDPDVKYLVVFDRQIDQGYAFVDRTTIDRQVRGQRVVFSTTDRSNGRMVIYAIG